MEDIGEGGQKKAPDPTDSGNWVEHPKVTYHDPGGRPAGKLPPNSPKDIPPPPSAPSQN